MGDKGIVTGYKHPLPQLQPDIQSPEPLRTCEACGEHYTPYAIFLCDNPLCFFNWMSFSDMWGRWLCQSCRAYFEKMEGMHVHKTCPEIVKERRESVQAKFQNEIV